ncbi:hypothetical protein OIE68_45275 [Nocardia vinacea]|uniref:hypothetical protein n=1 Tax=Nocardia vinacea TaxID=96468 RepID=UPI002E0FA110|nr:hypothetical protein OIE68_45275 [Nocardia vinacea]
MNVDNFRRLPHHNDPDLDALILRLHIETACRRGGALTLRLNDLDPEQCLIYLREKDGSDRSNRP